MYHKSHYCKQDIQKHLHNFRKTLPSFLYFPETKYFSFRSTLKIYKQRSNQQFPSHDSVIIPCWEKEFSLLVYTIPIIRLMLKLRKRKLVKKQNNYYCPYITKGFCVYVCIRTRIYFFIISSFS